MCAENTKAALRLVERVRKYHETLSVLLAGADEVGALGSLAEPCAFVLTELSRELSLLEDELRGWRNEPHASTLKVLSRI